MTPTTSKRLFLLAVVGIIAAAAGGSWWAYTQHKQGPTAESLAAGLTLSNQSTSKINVLKAPTESESGQTLTQSNQILPSTAQVNLVTETEVLPSTQPAVFDENAARLGTTLSLLLSTWGQGGVLPRQLANAAAGLAEQTGQKALASAAADLRRSTPREGPATLSLLLVEADKILALGAPKDLPETDAAAQAETSWFRRQIALLIHVGAPSSQTTWTSSMLTAQQLIARGAVADAANVLDTAPLGPDTRLNPLRLQLRTYLLQTGRLTHTITTYANTFLVPHRK